jgi:hypothetical protein
MVLDWRSRRYRGGSGWFSASIFAVSVGMVVPAVVITVAEGEIISVGEADTITISAGDRTILVAATDQTILIPERPTP